MIVLDGNFDNIFDSSDAVLRVLIILTFSLPKCGNTAQFVGIVSRLCLMKTLGMIFVLGYHKKLTSK
jgi:hypothetical protein